MNRHAGAFTLQPARCRHAITLPLRYRATDATAAKPVRPVVRHVRPEDQGQRNSTRRVTEM